MTTVAQAEATTSAAGPKWPADWDRVLDTAIRTWGGEWTTVRVQLLFKARYGHSLYRDEARAFLGRRAQQGLLIRINRPDGRYYTLARPARKDHP
jgi:hypothetical protein